MGAYAVSGETFTYDAYGLRIQLDRPLSELRPSLATGNLPLIRIVESRGQLRDSVPIGKTVAMKARRVCLRWPSVGTFLVDGKRRISFSPASGVSPQLIEQYLLAPVLPVLLHQRGQLVLHANALSIGGQAVVIAGHRSAGKSTLTAALMARGHQLLSDDVTAIDTAQQTPLVQPGFPTIKLWPDAAALLSGDVASLPKVDPRFEKRVVCLPDRFAPGPLPLRRVFVLEGDDGGEAARLPSSEALKRLLQHSYCAALVRLTDPAPHFRLCGALAASVAIKRLRVRRSMTDLPDLARQVERDVASDL